jgi:hypothetical protein
MSKHIPKHNLLSYVPFLLLGVVVMAIVPLWVSGVWGQSNPENPQEGSVGLSGVVPGEPPSQAPAINSPVDGQTFNETPIEVSGTCRSGLIVEIYTNDVFAGSTVCRDNNTFTIDTGLFFGENELRARVQDALGQEGPESDPVTVTYDPPVSESGQQIDQQLLIQSDVSFRGTPPGQPITFPVRLSGGQGPYAVSINWGDGDSNVISRTDTGNFDISHTYEQPGVYRIVIRATDDNDQTAFLQVTAAANGDIKAGVQDEDAPDTPAERVYVLWPLYILAAMVPFAFWLGMRHGKRRQQ